MDRRALIMLAALCAATGITAAIAADLGGTREWYRTVSKEDANRKWAQAGRMAMPPPSSSPRTDINVSVGCTTAYDSTNALYTYTYTVNNAGNSDGSLETFGFLPMKYQSAIVSPAHWWGFDRWQEELNCVVWTVVDNVGTVAPDTLTPAQIPLSPYCVPPGGSISGFQIVSRQPPGTVTWYAQAYDTLASAEADPSSTLLPVENTFFRLSVTGTVTGPDLQSVVGVNTQGAGAPELGLRWLGQDPGGRGGEFEYNLRQGGSVRLQVFDVQGRRIADLLRGYRPAGTHRAMWSGRGESGARIASGVYFARLEDGQGRHRVARVIISK